MSIPKKIISITLKSFNKSALNIYEVFIQKTFKKLDMDHSIFHLPMTKKRITLNKSPHVNKTAREQFEIKWHKTLIQIKDKENKGVNFPSLKLILMNRPHGVKSTIKLSGYQSSDM